MPKARPNRKTKPDRIKWMLALGAAVVLAFGVLMFHKRHSIFQHEPKFNLANYPVRGIDVSNHNGTIDWKQVADADYQFAYVKASEGKSHRDPAFKRNVRSAQQAGLLVGAYHFFRKNREGRDQAQNLLNAVEGLELDLPLVVDIEDWENSRWQDDKVVQQRFRDMVQALQKAGYRVMIYTNGDGYKKYIKDGQININLWLCAFKQPDKLKHIPHQLQQYSHWGRVKGIWGDVDLNVFNGSQEQWDKWLQDLTPQQFDIPVDSTLINDNEEYIIHDEL